jgi:group I intron endonuclease
MGVTSMENQGRPYGIIYLVTNLVNGKKYVGQTVQKFEKRKYAHEYVASKKPKGEFERAIREHGKENFWWTILCECSCSKELCEIETKFITELNSSIDKNGYNIIINGVPADAYRDKLSGENNGRYGDHRTWEELHGKEKSDKMKREKSELQKTPEHQERLKNLMKSRLKSWNPMNNQKSREKLSKTRMGGNNPNAHWHYIIEFYNRKFEGNSLSELCRVYNLNRNVIINFIKNPDYKTKYPEYIGCKVTKVLRTDR